MLDVGKNLVQGLWNGINNTAAWIMDKIRGFGSSILNGIKSFFGIASPSKVFEKQIGKNLALGIGEGFSASMKDVSKQMQNAIPADFEIDMNNAVNYVNASESLSGNNSQKIISNGVDTEFLMSRKKEIELLELLLNETHGLNESLCGKIVKVLVDGVSLRVDNREIARLVRRYA